MYQQSLVQLSVATATKWLETVDRKMVIFICRKQDSSKMPYFTKTSSLSKTTTLEDLINNYRKGGNWSCTAT